MRTVQHPYLMCFCLKCCVQTESWKSQEVLEIKGETGRRVRGCVIKRKSLNMAYHPVTKVEYFLLTALALSQICFQTFTHLFMLG